MFGRAQFFYVYQESLRETVKNNVTPKIILGGYEIEDR